MKIVVATDSFKGTLSSVEAGHAMREGVLRVRPDAEVIVVPMADGGEGTVEAVLAGAGGSRIEAEVLDPLGRPVRAAFGQLPDGRTAIVEMAASSGLTLLRFNERDPLRTSTFGTGQQLSAALDAGATRLLIGVGGSATVDGGCGCAQALGVQFLSEDGTVLPAGLPGGDLHEIHRIDVSARDARLDAVELVVLCDVQNPLCGPNGASAVYGPQKGAGPEQVRRLETNLRHLARVIERDLGIAVADVSGGGASGGLAAGLVAFLGGRMQSGVESVIMLTRLFERVQGADLVITGEGRFDAQSRMGKAVWGVVACVRRTGVPVVVVAGSVAGDASLCEADGISALCAVSGPQDPVPASPATAAQQLRDRTAEFLRERFRMQGRSSR
ncbi:MAG: glycerate kinase [Phycisphaerae bacterium]|nr:glycerate kinase [Phycisphaerae bacterium]